MKTTRLLIVIAAILCLTSLRAASAQEYSDGALEELGDLLLNSDEGDGEAARDAGEPGDPLLPEPLNETTYQAPALPDWALLHEVRDRSAGSAIEARSIEIEVGDQHLKGYQASPAETTPTAAVLLLHDWLGLGEPVREEVRAWARLGYRAFAPDLYGGEVAADRRQAARLMRLNAPGQVQPQARTALGWLREPGGEAATLPTGVIGYGPYGAAVAVELSREQKGAEPADAAVLFYGGVAAPPQNPQEFTRPMLGLFSRHDGYITPVKVDRFARALSEAGLRSFRFEMFSANPGFALDAEAQADETSAAIQARRQADAFLREVLSPAD